MKKIILLLFVLYLPPAFSQVGINTTTPHATLDVRSSDQTDPDITDGILIPKVDQFALTPPTNDQIGMLVYLTTAQGSDYPPGFYYWNGTEWVSLRDGRGWDISGNSGTVDGTHFIGTVDDVPLNFRIDNTNAGRIEKNNTFLGYQSGNANTTGDYNIAFGYQSLYSNTLGRGNTALGYQSLYNNVGNLPAPNGWRNTAVGYQSLYANIDGQYNTAIGYASMGNGSGNSNTAVGYQTLYGNRGANNSAFGFEALYSNTSGIHNTAIGRESLRGNTTGENNIAIGSYALHGNTTGDYNTALGYQALVSNRAGDRATAVGARAMYFANNTLTVYVNTNVALGFEALRGSNTPANNTGNNNTALGYRALLNNSTGNNNTAIGYQAGYDQTLGSNNIMIGYNAQVPDLTGSNQVRLGNDEILFAYIEVPWTSPSDRRKKENIRTSPLGLDFIKQLHPVDYIRINNKNKSREFGFIAQELEEALLKTGYENYGMISKDDNGYMSVRYNDLIPILAKAIQEQQDLIEKNDERITELESSVRQQQTALDKQQEIIESLQKDLIILKSVMPLHADNSKE